LSVENLNNAAEVLSGGDILSLYSLMIHHDRNPLQALRTTEESADGLWQSAGELQFSDDYKRFQYVDILDYLPDDILTKVDRASMAVSLEARVPILDHRVVEFAMTLPETLKVRNGQSKWILRQVLNKYVPNSLTDQPKMGFSIPVDEWLKGSLKDWGADLISKNSIDRVGVFDYSEIQRRWHEHQTNTKNWQHHLWDVLMLQDWALKNEVAVSGE